MKCTEVKENSDALLDERLDLSEKERIKSHLGICGDCKAEFESLENISTAIKQTLPVVAPATLDAKVFRAFENQQAKIASFKSEEKSEKIGWFGIPKLAFAGAFLLLAICSGLAFQVGRLSAGDVQISVPLNAENKRVTDSFSDENNFSKTKIVEVPVIREKIIKVPVIREKIVTKTIYIDKTRKKTTKLSRNDLPNSIVALDNSVKDGELLTRTNLRGFQPVSEIKPVITKKED